MNRRTLASLAFIVEGIVTWVILQMLLGYGRSQAGMSASAMSGGSSDGDTVFFLLTGIYFLLSAVGIIICETKKALRIGAVIAHAFLLIPMLALSCFGPVLFMPALVIWSLFLFGGNKDTKAK